MNVIIMWHSTKVLVEQSIPISHDSLHVIVGVLVWILLASASKNWIASHSAWLGLAGIIICNEAVDLSVEHWPDRGHQFVESAKDLILTLLLPTLLLVLARRRDRRGKR